MSILTPYTQKQYKQGILKLLPKGKLWDSFREDTTYLNKIIEAFSFSYQQIDEDACSVIDEVFPGTTENLLPIWQETVGLTATDETIKRQRAEVIAKLTQTASLAKAYYISYAEQLGFDIDIKEYSGIISGLYRCGDTVGTCDDYTYQFDITIILKGSLVTDPLSEVITYDGTNLELKCSTLFINDDLPTEDPNIKGALWDNGTF